MKKTITRKQKKNQTRKRSIKGGNGHVFETKDELETAINMFRRNKGNAIETYGAINTWDVSRITDMSKLFLNAIEFDEDISGWDVSNVTNMNSMFSHAQSFNKPLNSCNVSNVTNMNSMFYG
jgi:surface protein